MNAWRYSPVLVASLLLTVAACSTVRYSADYDQEASFSQFRTYSWETLSEDEQAALARANPFLERRLQRAVDVQLAESGFVGIDDGDPDFWVSAYPVIPTRAEGSQGGRAAGYPYAVAPRSNVSVSVGFGFGYPFWFGYPHFGFWTPYFGNPYRIGYGPRLGFRGSHWGYPRFGFYPAFGVAYRTGGGRGYRAGGALGGLGIGTLVVDVSDAETGDLIWRGWAEGALQEAPGTDQLTAYIDDVVAKIMKDFPPPNATR
jgi:hypothetical protein